MAAQSTQQNNSFADNIWDETFKKYQDENITNIGKGTRKTEAIKTDEILETQKPFFSTLMSSWFCHNNAIMLKMMEDVVRKVISEEIKGVNECTNKKLIDLTIKNDNLDSANRQDNLIILGHEERL